MVFHGFWLVSMVFQGGFMVFHDFWLVSMVFQGGFMFFMVFGWFQWFFMVPGWFVMVPGWFFSGMYPPQTVSWPDDPV